MRRRIFGIECEYGVTCTVEGDRHLSPDEVARYLFRRVVSWGRSSNVYLENGSRLYLDVGAHPEYATPECDSVIDVVTHEKAGERILEGLAKQAERRLAKDGVNGRIHLFKNNTDFAGNSYGSHENYLLTRNGDFQKIADVLIPFLITRQIYAGAGNVLRTPNGARYSISQRAEHIWEGLSSATTRSRPIINSRDEPHADPERYRRLHVIVGDSNMNEYTTWLKMSTCDLVLRLIESGAVMRDLNFENPIHAIRAIAQDLTLSRRVNVRGGRELTALEIQWEYLERVAQFVQSTGSDPETDLVMSEWTRILSALGDDPFKLTNEVDWVAKYAMIEDYRQRWDLPLSHSRVSMVDLQYHDVDRKRGLFYVLQRNGHANRVTDDHSIAMAMTRPPNTRAKLRGDFVKAAKNNRRDYTVDWVHLKLNDQAQRTVVCRDPFVSEDDRVRRLIDAASKNTTTGI